MKVEFRGREIYEVPFDPSRLRPETSPGRAPGLPDYVKAKKRRDSLLLCLDTKRYITSVIFEKAKTKKRQISILLFLDEKKQKSSDCTEFAENP